MKRNWTLLAVVFLAFSPGVFGQCGIYTYQDLWIDDNNNAVGDNLTHASCYRSSAYAEVHVAMPSGSTVVASSTGTNSAEAVAQNLNDSTVADGRFFGFNVASSECFLNETESFFDNFFKTAYTKVHWKGTKTRCIGVPDPRYANCDYDVEPWCTPATSGPSFNPSQVTDPENPAPLGYWEAGALCVRVLPSLPFICPNITAYALQTPISSRGECTRW